MYRNDWDFIIFMSQIITRSLLTTTTFPRVVVVVFVLLLLSKPELIATPVKKRRRINLEQTSHSAFLSSLVLLLVLYVCVD